MKITFKQRASLLPQLFAVALISISFANPAQAQSSEEHNADFVRRIVGGTETTRGAWPWIVAIVSRGESNLLDGQSCGGTLIHPYWVLSAAHCFENDTADSVDVVIGVHNLRTDNPSSYTRIEVAEIIQHHSYEDGDFTTDGDIALLRLKQPVMNVTPLSLVTDPALAAPGKISKVLGWGLTSDGGSGSEFLREVDLPIVSLQDANNLDAFGSPLSEDMLPAGNTAGGQDSCQGDSGGPLIVRNASNTGWELAGVVSFGAPAGCAAPNTVGIYARVTYFHDWIQNHLNPGFASWAKDPSVTGPLNNTDGDTLNHFAEYAFGSNPSMSSNGDAPTFAFGMATSVEYPTIKFRRRKNATNIDYQVSYSTDLATWTPVANAANNTLSVQSIDTDTEMVTLRSDVARTAGSIQYMRLNLATPAGFQPVSFPETNRFRFKGTLDATLPSDPIRTSGAFHIREFNLDGLKASEAVTFQFTSSAFSPFLQIINVATGQVVTSSGMAGQGSVILMFTPMPGVKYRARLSSATAGATGAYAFNYPPEGAP